MNKIKRTPDTNANRLRSKTIESNIKSDGQNNPDYFKRKINKKNVGVYSLGLKQK